MCFWVGNQALWAKPIYILFICCLYFPIPWHQIIPITKFQNKCVTFQEFWATLLKDGHQLSNQDVLVGYCFRQEWLLSNNNTGEGKTNDLNWSQAFIMF